jgi:hypothetical protein
MPARARALTALAERLPPELLPEALAAANREDRTAHVLIRPVSPSGRTPPPGPLPPWDETLLAPGPPHPPRPAGGPGPSSRSSTPWVGRRPSPKPPAPSRMSPAGGHLCRQIVAAFTGQAVVDWADRLDWPIERNGITLRVVKDLSEMAEEAGANLLWELALESTGSAAPLRFPHRRQ